MKRLWAIVALAAATPALAKVGGGDITFQVKGAEKAVFSHDRHVAGAKLGCRECHPKLYLDTKQHKPVTMKQMAQKKSCGACHDGRRAVGLGECASCHR